MPDALADLIEVGGRRALILGREIMMGRTSKAILFASSILGACPAIAQDEAEQGDEIIVTATRRDATVQDVPYNISAVSGDDLERAGATGLDDLADMVPGLNFIDLGARGSLVSSAISIRGINAENAGNFTLPLASVSPVSTYVDETPVFASLRLTDLERVEILRGPQGTLYGSGSLGGTVRLIQRKPQLGKVEGRLSGSLGKTRGAGSADWQTDAMINLPLGDTLAIRATAGYERSAGYIDYTNLYVLGADRSPSLAIPANVLGSAASFTTKRDANRDTSWNGRVAVLWEPSDKFNAQLAYHRQSDKSAALEAITPLAYGDRRLANASFGLSPFENDIDLVSLDLEGDLGFAKLSTSTSYSRVKASGTSEVTGTYLNFSFYEGTYGANPRDLVLSDSGVRDKSFTQEVRLVSQHDGPLEWVAGAFYRKQDYTGSLSESAFGQTDYFRACAAANGFDPLDPAYEPFSGAYPPGAIDCGTGSPFGVPGLATVSGVPVVKDLAYINNFDQKFTDTALFGELTYHITSNWQVTGGVRAFWQSFRNTQQNGAFYTARSLLASGIDPALAVRTITAKTKVKDVIFKANTSYDFTPDHKAYLTFSQGFRRGGVNGLPPVIFDFTAFDVIDVNPALTEYAPDKVNNYELGFKGRLGRINYSMAGFLIDWDNIQVNSLVTSNALAAVVNGGKARSKGIELELDGKITDNLSLMASYTYTRAKMRSFSPLLVNEVFFGVAPTDLSPQLPGTPKSSFAIGGSLTVPLANENEIIFDLNANYTGRINTSIDPAVSRDIPGYMTADFAVSYAGRNWDVSFAIDNLFDKRAAFTGELDRLNSPQAESLANFFILRPRSFNLKLTYRFD